MRYSVIKMVLFCLGASVVSDKNSLIFIILVMYVIFFSLDVSKILVFVFNNLCLGMFS